MVLEEKSVLSPIIFVTHWMDLAVCPIEFEFPRSVEFSVPGRPRGKERPRTVRIGGHITTYTPKQTVEYENLVRARYKESAGDIYLENSIRADIEAIYPIPKSATKKEKAGMLSGEIPCTKKPDCDNIGKIILDALNKTAYDDASQACKLFVEKSYGEEPQVKVKLSELT